MIGLMRKAIAQQFTDEVSTQLCICIIITLHMLYYWISEVRFGLLNLSKRKKHNNIKAMQKNDRMNSRVTICIYSKTCSKVSLVVVCFKPLPQSFYPNSLVHWECSILNTLQLHRFKSLQNLIFQVGSCCLLKSSNDAQVLCAFLIHHNHYHK